LIGSTSGENGTNVAGFTTGGGSSYSELDLPTGIFIVSNGIMYILDSGNYRVLRWTVDQPLGFVVAGGQGSGTTLNKISTSYGLYVDDQSRIYISEYSNHRVTRWDNTTAGILVKSNNFIYHFD
jgi:hypothetical protein